MTDTTSGGNFSPGLATPSPAPENSPEYMKSVELGIDLFAQAFKTLSERSPFDSAEVLSHTCPSLPSGLARLLDNRSDSHRKRKRNHSDMKSSWNSSEKAKKSNTWVELEGYCRQLALGDFERLYRLSSSFLSVESSSSCLDIRELGNVDRSKNYNGDMKVENGVGGDFLLVENVVMDETGSAENADVLDSVNVEVKEEEVEVKSDKKKAKLEESRDRTGIVDQGSVVVSSMQLSSSIEWVLGSRNRVLLTTTRPSKKRKLLGENAGLERLMVAQPYEGSSSICHVCSIGDTGDQLNKLVVCKSCNVVVHQKCYGIQADVHDSWVCSWCNQKSDALSCDRPCVLCPLSSGALKRFQRGDNEGSVEFAHLFCAQWLPEVYIGDTRTMEPLLCGNGLKDVQGKLVCSLCKLKLGSCVRCSDGPCRTPFHPICAREAKNKVEIWGKFGCDDIELRAFCSNHSGNRNVAGPLTLEKKDLGDSVGNDQLGISAQQGSKMKKLKIDRKNGDKVTLSVGTVGSVKKTSAEHVSQEVMSNTEIKSGSDDLQDSSELKAVGHMFFQDKVPYLDLGMVLKKLMDRGKVSLQQIASEINVTEDYLAAKLSDNLLGPEMSCKIMKWVKEHAYLDTSEKDLRTNVGRLLPPKAESGNDDHSDAVVVIDLDMPDVPVKSVPPRRRIIGNTVKEDNLLRSRKSINQGIDHEQVNINHNRSSKDEILDSTEKIIVETNGFAHPLRESSPASESILLKTVNARDVECSVAKEVSCPGKSSVVDFVQQPPYSINTVGYSDGDLKPGADSLVHPCIKMKLEEVQCLLVQKACPEFNGGTEVEPSATNESIISNVYANNNIDESCESSVVEHGNLRKAEDMGILDLAPENEVEGEITFLQQWLLHNAVVLKHRTDHLLCKVVRNLPYEMDAVRDKRWDDVLVNQYNYILREERKQRRKERRCKEAQVVLAAATEAAAASTRVSSLQKYTVDESSQQQNPLKVENSRIRGRSSSLSVPKAMSDGDPDMCRYNPGSPKEHLKLCDICGCAESLLNPILLCLTCKVAVHLNCYRSVKQSTGPWYCELCEESSLSKASRKPIVKPQPIVECGLCSASNGAFRKSSTGQWIHAFCAEWVFDSTFRRGQVLPVSGMETLHKDSDICSVCHRRFGVCIKCNHGNCQATFHPSCARSAGYYMNTKYVGGGQIQRKAYCSKHGLEQKAKAETQKRGAGDLKIVKQHRVELEKLRLLCERIVRREKVKRESLLCNYDILASKREALAVSIHFRRPIWAHEGSSESATTSLRGDSRSFSEAMQKSDDVTIDSSLSSKLCIRLPLSIDNDQKTDDSSISQCIPTPKSIKPLFAGKQLPVRAKKSGRNFSESRDKVPKS